MPEHWALVIWHSGVKREAGTGAAWLAGAGITAIIGYLIATVSAGGRHPSWPYLVFAVLTAIGAIIYIASRRSYRIIHSGETVINSSEGRPLGHDFAGNEGKLFADGAHFGERGRGELSFIGNKNEIISVLRTNHDGKYELALRRYPDQGDGHGRVLPGNAAVSWKRLLRVSCEAKVTGGTHRLVFGWKPAAGGYRLDEKEVLVARESWIHIALYFKVDPARDCYLRIDDYYQTGPTPGALQIRRIVVAEQVKDR